MTAVAAFAPHDDEEEITRLAEGSLLGAILILASAAKCPTFIRAADFGDPRNAAIFKAMLSLEADELPIDLVMVNDQLIQSGTHSLAGGAVYLASLVDRVPDVENIEGYARHVRAQSLKRQAAALRGK